MDDIIVPELQNVDTTLIIDPDTRTIDAGSDFLLGVETDNDAERVKFQCSKIVGDNLDLSQYHIYIHYQNAKGEKGKYLCEDIEDGGENITFSWLLSQKAVLYKGQTKFLVCAKKTQEDTIVWNTTLANGNVLEGLDVDEDIVQQNDDVIEQILLKLEQIEASGGSYTLPIATPTQLGGVKPVAKTDEMTQEVGVDEAGGLFTKKGDGIDEETLNQINRNTEDIGKLSDSIDDLKDNGTGGGVVVGEVRKMLTTHVIGEVLDKTEEYNSWVFENVKYDAELDRIIVVWNASDSHVDTYKVCYLGVFNHYTFEFEEIKVINDSRESNDLYCIYGFVILKDGSYLYAPCYDTGVGATASSSIRLMKSTDKGDSWTEVNPTFNNLPSSTEYFPFSITLLSSGRLLMTDGKSYVFMYSDNNGLTWECTKVSVRLFEPHFVECGNSKIVCLCRKTSFGTTNGKYDGTEMQIEPAVVFTSEDNGVAWTHKGDSTTITDMTASNCCSVVKDGYIDLFVCSRYPYADKKGVMYHYYASVENAFADNWGTPKVVFYPDCASKSDFSYGGCCADKNGNTHLFYYDGDSSNEGSCTIKYLLASNNAVSIPLNTDDIHVPKLPYSSKMIDSMFAVVNKKINQLILQGGGSVENDGSLDGSMYVTDGLYEMFDFTMESSYDAETQLYTGLIAKETMKKTSAEWGGTPTDTSFNPNGLVQCGTLQNDIAASVPRSSYTLELSFYRNADVTSVTGKIMRVSGSSSGIPTLYESGSIADAYKATDGSAKWISKGENNNVKLNIGFHMLTIVSDGNSVKSYKNGKLYTSVVWADYADFGSFVEDSALILMKPTIGLTTDETSIYNKGFRIYNRPLTAEEVKNNYQYESASYQ